jgi:rhamnose utilization protein RhaD (predicted bifunctional aldolase and dehydrogenase)
MIGVHHPETTALIELSARLGFDPLLVQGGAGNTSIKIDDVLWIKASGKWLARAKQDEILIPLDLPHIRRSIRERNMCCLQYTSPAGKTLAPSIETAMHAVVPHRVTLHVHSVNTIAWAVRQDGPAHVAKRLAGLRWQWIPYTPSGLPLAFEVQKSFERMANTQVLILANHGLVVCGDDCTEAEAVLRQVEERLNIAPRYAAPFDRTALNDIIGNSDWQLPHVAHLHALGTDALSRTILESGILYPCQAIFLGPKLPVVPPSSSISEAAERYTCRYGISPAFLVVEDAGVLLSSRMTRAELETLVGLAHVAQRIDADAPLRYLNDLELHNLLKAEALQYRQLVEKQ